MFTFRLIRRTIVFLPLLCFLLSVISPQLYGQVYARHGMVVASEKVAAGKGRDILQQGGNAIDAAVTTAFCLAVTWPSAGNIGGGGFLVYLDKTGKSTTIDFREKAPLPATPTMYLDSTGQLIQDKNHLSALAVGVPGTVAGLYLAHQKYGKLPWATVVQPAVDLAEKGVPFSWSLYRSAHRIKENWQDYPDMVNYMLKDNGNYYEPGELWTQPELAETLKLIRDKGRDGFYKGEAAKKFEAYMKKTGGIITRKDLRKYEAVERTPVKSTYRDYDVIGMPPPSSGGVAMIEMLNMLENYDLDTIPFNSAAHIHLLTEVMRRAFADRAAYLGDPDFNPDMPVDKLLSKEHARLRTQSIDPHKASSSDSTRFGQLYDGASTTHLSVLDEAGNAVSLTYTLEYSYGSRLVVEGLGFILNNEMGDFNAVPGLTNREGLIGTAANMIAPEKRMLSSMTPTIIAREGKPVLIIGSPGGRTIINTVFQTVVNVLDYGMTVDNAIEACKIHHQWLPERVLYERWKLSPDTRLLLEAMSHEMVAVSTLGALMGITFDAEHKVITGAADSSRPDGGAEGY